MAVPVADLVISLASVLVESLLKLNLASDAAEDVKRAMTILGRMRAYLNDYCSSEQIDKGPEVIQNRAKDIQNIVYDVEDALAKFMVKVPHHFHNTRFHRVMHHVRYDASVWNASRKLSEKIKKIESQVSSFASDALPVDQPIGNTNHEEDCNNWVTYQQDLEEDEVVGFEETKRKLILQLKEGNNSKSPMIISIVGSAGSGKTTLVKNVYKSTTVRGFFDCHAFVDVPCPFEPQALLLNMLSKFKAHLIQEPAAHHHQILHQHVEILKADLKKLLEQKRYVVVLDNVWRYTDLEFIVKTLPNGLLGSKIIITARNSDIIAPFHTHSLDYIHDLSMVLSSKEANKLFCKKAFHGDCNNCPPELEELAENILKKCERVPLIISVVGTLLAQKPQNWVEWKKFHDSLGFILHHVWDPSYVDLPNHLRSCFLYFSMFPEDYSIKCERLIRLWVAEGFVLKTRDNTMEEVADGYLKQLIGRNLVEVSAREIDGNVRSCRVPNLVRKFIISKAENFITVLESSSSTTGASTSTANSGERIRRLSAHYVHNNNFSSTGRDLNWTRTLMMFGHGQQPPLPHKALKILKYLRVLDLKGVPLQDFPKCIYNLTILKYISMRETKIKTITKSIKKLAHLETLDLKRTQLTELPKEIYELHKMRHLLVNRICDLDDDGPPQGVEVSSAGDIGAFSDLQKLSLIKVGNNTTILKALAELTGLRKLGLTHLRADHGRELCCAIEKLVRLSTLELRSISEEEYLELDHMILPPPRSLQHLSMEGRLRRSLPQWIPQLASVVKIVLKRSKLDADATPLESLEALPNLMELHLFDFYTGEELIFKNETFKMLKTLRIEQFDHLHMMKVGRGAMPKLKKLTISKCKKLELLPLGIADLSSLEELFLYEMHSDFIANLKKGSEYRQEVQHIRIIHSVDLCTGFQNLS